MSGQVCGIDFVYSAVRQVLCACVGVRERELVSAGGSGGGGHLMYSLLSMCPAMESSASNADTQ